MKNFKTFLLFTYLACVLATVYILRMMPMDKRDDYSLFTNSVIAVSVALILYYFVTIYIDGNDENT